MVPKYGREDVEGDLGDYGLCWELSSRPTARLSRGLSLNDRDSGRVSLVQLHYSARCDGSGQLMHGKEDQTYSSKAFVPLLSNKSTNPPGCHLQSQPANQPTSPASSAPMARPGTFVHRRRVTFSLQNERPNHDPTPCAFPWVPIV